MWLSRHSLALLTYGPLAYDLLTYDLLTYDLLTLVLMVPRVSLVVVTQSTVTPSVSGSSIDSSVPDYLASSANLFVTVQGRSQSANQSNQPISHARRFSALIKRTSNRIESYFIQVR